MASYYVLNMDVKQDQLSVVYHVLIPAAATNFAGLTFRNAIVERDSPVSALPDTFNGADITVEKAKVASGELYEVQKTIQFDANLSNANKKAVIDADYTATSAQILSELQNSLEFWGYSTTV